MKHLWLLALLLAFATGCGNSNKSVPSMSGNWTFTATSGPLFVTVTGSGSLTQSGASVTGTLTLAGTPCASTAALKGTLNGTNLSFQLNESGQAVTLTGIANADLSSASGGYSSPTVGCTNGDYGTWTAVKH